MSADYKSTVFLPKTDFPMRGSLPEREPEILARWEALDLYRRQREAAPGVEDDGLADLFKAVARAVLEARRPTARRLVVDAQCAADRCRAAARVDVETRGVPFDDRAVAAVGTLVRPGREAHRELLVLPA